jgi:hypothetical protein
VPSEQTVVTLEPCGTTTVVLGLGAGGLLLLMQADNSGTTHNAANRIFMSNVLLHRTLP